MACFTLGFLQALIIQCIVIAAIVAVLKLLIPWLVEITGYPILGRAIMIILWAIIAIMIVYIIFALLSCLSGGAGFGHFPR